MKAYIGIDLGTSAVKALLMSADGEVLDTVSKPYPISYPKSNWSEQNPEDWYVQTLAGLEALLENHRDIQVCGLAFCGQMHGLVVLDKNGEVIRPAILWNDGRSVQETEWLNSDVGYRSLIEYTGNIAFAGFTAPKLIWLHAKEPKSFALINKILLPKDYLIYRFTGVFASDPSDASGTLYYDVDKRCWSQEMLDICNIREEMLPTVYESSVPVGWLKPEIASRLGIGSVLVAAGAGDNAGAAVGTGVVVEGTCSISLGTSGTVFIPSSTSCAGKNNGLHYFAHANGHWHLMGCMLSAASCCDWWIKRILEADDFEREEHAFAETTTLDEKVFFMPYLMGERCPHNDPKARGVFIGMDMSTSRSGMVRALYEGITFALRDSVEAARHLGVTPRKARLCGGGAKSIIWRQLCADILNMEMEIPMVEEGPAMGAAILAAVACGEYPDVTDAASRIVRIKETVSPNIETVRAYDKKYVVFTELYPQIAPLFLNL